MNYMKVGIDASKEKWVCAYRANGVGEIVQVCYEASSVGYASYRWVTGFGGGMRRGGAVVDSEKSGQSEDGRTRRQRIVEFI